MHSQNNQSKNNVISLSNEVKQDIEQRFNNLEVYKNIKEDNYTFRPFFDEALDIKAQYGKQASVYFLNLEADKKNHKTALHLEAEGGRMMSTRRFWLTKFMLQEGADFHKVDALGNTALHTVMSDFNFMISPAKNDQDVIEGTAKSQMSIAACLLAYGADPTIKNKAGQTPWDCLQQALNKLDPQTVNKFKDIFTLKGLSSAYQQDIADGKRVKSAQSSLNFRKHRVFHDYSDVVGLENIAKWEGKIPDIIIPAQSSCSIQ